MKKKITSKKSYDWNTKLETNKIFIK